MQYLGDDVLRYNVFYSGGVKLILDFNRRLVSNHYSYLCIDIVVLVWIRLSLNILAVIGVHIVFSS